MQTVRLGIVEIGGDRPCVIVPLTSPTLDGLMDEAMALAELPADLAEWRIDLLEGAAVHTAEGPMPDLVYILQVLAGLRTVLPVPLIASFRTEAEGGRCPMSDKGYEELCAALCDSRNVDVLDVEAFHRSGRAPAVIAHAHARRVPVLASYHDFAATPEKDEMVRRLRLMQDELGADILKIAVMPQSRADVLALLSAAEEMASVHAERPLIAVGMGKAGAVSRLCGHVFGSAATFACAGNASAPGQMDVRDVASVLEGLDRLLS